MAGNTRQTLGLWGLFLVVAVAATAWLALGVSTPEPARPRGDGVDPEVGISDDLLLRLVDDQATVRAGARLFSRYCSRCHGSVGEGSIGPNLTDDFWIGGDAPVDIYWTIHDGRLARGMPAAGALGAAACKQVAAYVLAVRGRNLPGRPPQGKRSADAPSAGATRVAGR